MRRHAPATAITISDDGKKSVIVARAAPITHDGRLEHSGVAMTIHQW
jgi:hypothetical protein